MPPKPTRLQIADLELDRLSRTVWRAGRKIELKPREYELLEYLVLRQGQVVTWYHAAGGCLGLPLRAADGHWFGAYQPATVVPQLIHTHRGAA